MILDHSFLATTSSYKHRYFTNDELNSAKYRLARFFVHHLDRLSMCDANNIHQVLKDRWRSCKFFGFSHQQNEAISKRPHVKRLWPLFLLAFYLAVSLRLTILLVLQFTYDSSKAKLTFLRALRNATDQPNCDPIQSQESVSLECQLEHEYQKQIESSYATMKLLGNPYVHIMWVHQAAILVALGTVSLSYFVPQLLINYGPPHRMFLFDLLLDDKLEFSRLEAKIRSEFRQLTCSSWNLVRTTMELVEVTFRQVSHENSEQVNRLQLENWSTDSALARIQRDLMLIIHQAKRRNLSSKLHPINRSSIEWRKKIIDKFLQASILNLIYSFLLDWTFLYFVHLLSPIKLEFVTWADRLVLVELWIYFQLSVFATNHHLTAFIIHCDNQMKYIEHMVSRLNQLMAANERNFIQMLACKSSSSFECNYKLMNGRLVEALLEYRMFLAQLQDFIAALKIAVRAGLVVFFLAPLASCIYSPYLAIGGCKTLCTLFSINTSFFADLILAPVCSFENKGHQLYRALSSLLAHTIDLEQQSRDHFQGRSIYMKLPIEMLRKELNDPDRMLGHFITSIPGFSATFPNLIEIHFYFSVLNLALYFKIEAWKSILGNRLDDPFQIFQL